jgi:2-keto-3-deoxy-L-rhamnonate aldolase RhmA
MHPSLRTSRLVAPLLLGILAACGGDGAPEGAAGGPPGTIGSPAGRAAADTLSGAAALVDLWNEGLPAFGIFVPDERPRPAERPPPGTPRPAPVHTAAGATELARNPLYDFLFLNLEGSWDPAHVQAMVEGLRAPGVDSPPALLVRIPTMEDAGAEATRERVREILELGADGVVLPHIRSVEEARLAISFFHDIGADVWSPSNRTGRVIAMLMVEDPDAVAVAGEIADLGGFSVLACGIGSLTAALGGDREAAEAGNQQVLAQVVRVGMADMITADTASVARRVEEGFVGLLMSGEQADEAIRIGRAAAGR